MMRQLYHLMRPFWASLAEMISNRMGHPKLQEHKTFWNKIRVIVENAQQGFEENC